MPESIHNVRNPIGAENSQKVVFQGKIESGGSRIALPSGSSPQLIVDPPGFVSLGSQDMKPSGLNHLLLFLLDDA